MTSLYTRIDDLKRTVGAVPIENAELRDVVCEMADCLEALAAKVQQLEKETFQAGNAASALANGMTPD